MKLKPKPFHANMKNFKSFSYQPSRFLWTIQIFGFQLILALRILRNVPLQSGIVVELMVFFITIALN